MDTWTVQFPDNPEIDTEAIVKALQYCLSSQVLVRKLEPSKRNSGLRRACSKTMFKTEAEAKRALARIQSRPIYHPESYYPCKDCSGYHLTGRKKVS